MDSVQGYMVFQPCGLPHSEIPGSMDICSYPRLIAAYHVLHRLPVPRHPPCALCSLTNTLLIIQVDKAHRRIHMTPVQLAPYRFDRRGLLRSSSDETMFCIISPGTRRCYLRLSKSSEPSLTLGFEKARRKRPAFFGDIVSKTVLPQRLRAEENLVEIDGFEPTTSALQKRRSPN